ncbi:uncharacterized protein LOC115998991 isoform X2 [Ipomoea triloba]|uniref:uncharacterized protein LOC115998991 isoform X2 n=1 Tax=Ipomoea triloba TaxID=35885 RepID=UPI00125D1CAD|nr:uncharacterized protein LOC115998991 isoform X2 [Ipomoea triloba]
MENGGGNLESKFSGLALRDSPNGDGLFQVMKAVEAAEATIKQQVEENNWLRSELQEKIQALEKYKSGEPTIGNFHSVEQWDGHPGAFESSLHSGDRTDGPRRTNSSIGPGLPNNVVHNYTNSTIQRAESSSDYGKVNSTERVTFTGVQTTSDVSGLSHFSSRSTSPFSPSRYQIAGEQDRQLNLSGQGFMPMAEVNDSNSTKQDLVLKIQAHEQEISQLRKHLEEYSIKEEQISNEKYVLDKRIAYMRMAFDQQQQDLVDAASKAISYRQDIIEENIHLTYLLQDAQQERSTFISSLLPLLAEYYLQPPVPDAQSIVSNVKILFRHLQEKLLVTEAKLKESQYQMTPWPSDVNSSNFAQSPSDFSVIRDGLELVPQQGYTNEKAPILSDPQTSRDWDSLGHPQVDSAGDLTKNMMGDELGRYSPLASRNTISQDLSAQLAVSQDDSLSKSRSEEIPNKQVTFSDHISNNEMDDYDMERHQNGREPSASWHSKSSPYTNPLEDLNPHSPYLPPVMEEPASSFSEDDEPLPAVEGLQISGEAFPGQELKASGYSINGTTSCNFEWVRHMEDGSFNYIVGAKQPTYLVTADDVDTYLAIEVQPLDNRKRKGELVKVFANDHRKITCVPEMHKCIQRTLSSGHASYKVFLWTGYLDIWEPATLSIKRDGFSIKCSGPNAVAVTEKFSQSINVSIPYGSPTEFVITDSLGDERRLRAGNDLSDISCSRDTIVLTMRLFIVKAGEKKKSRKRGLFFK